MAWLARCGFDCGGSVSRNDAWSLKRENFGTQRQRRDDPPTGAVLTLHAKQVQQVATIHLHSQPD